MPTGATRRSVLIAGSAVVLASQLAALLLLDTDDAVVLGAGSEDGPSADRLEALVAGAAERRRAGGGGLAAAGWRIRYVAGEPWPLEVDELWCCSGGFDRAPGRGCRMDGALVRSLLAWLPGSGVARFNHVVPALAGAASDDELARTYRRLEREVVERCEASGIGHRTFRLDPPVDRDAPEPGPGRAGIPHLLAVLHELKAEIDSRAPWYLAEHPLRYHAPEDAVVNVLPVERAAELLLAAGDGGEGPSPGPFPLRELFGLAGQAYGLSLRVAPDAADLNGVDRLFRDRLHGFGRVVVSAAPGAAPSAFGPTGDSLLDVIQSVRRAQDEAALAERARVASLRGRLVQRAINAGDAPLLLSTGGAGEPPLVVLNALGQGLSFWMRLLDRLLTRHRLVAWDARGLEPAGRPFRLDDHVDDLERVLAAERIEACHLLGWCTGPKVALEFQRRHPETVSSMVFLNGSFKRLRHDDGLDTAYEHNLDALFGMLDRHPQLAPRLMRVLGGWWSAERPSAGVAADAEAEAAGVLTSADRALLDDQRAPFLQESTMLAYARQMLDFWSHDGTAHAAQVRTPILCIGAEHDQVVSTERFRAAAGLFPTARFGMLRGATHYGLYERPDLVAGLIEDFLRDPELPIEVDGEVRWERRQPS